MYTAKQAVCSEIPIKHSTQSAHHVEFKTWWYVKKPLGFKRLTLTFIWTTTLPGPATSIKYWTSVQRTVENIRVARIYFKHESRINQNSVR
jgi:hypothetical protein